MSDNKKPEQSEIDSFINSELTKADQRRDEAMKSKGLHPFLSLENGINEFTLEKVMPTTRVSSYDKDQYVFTTTQDGETKDWTVTINSPFAREVLAKLKVAPINVTVMRSGKGKDTRYEFVED